MRKKVELYRIKEEEDLTPKKFANLVAFSQYERRFGPLFVGPMVAGIDVTDNNKPFLADFDSIGAITLSEEFLVSGTAGDFILGACESFYKKDMSPDQLFETTSQCLISGVDRDASSGWGGLVYTIVPGKISVKRLKFRQD